MVVSELWILTERGEPLITKKYRQDVNASSSEEFSILMKKEKNILMPYNVIRDLHLYHIKRQGLYFLAVSKIEIHHTYAIELLARFYQLCKDFCGTVSEQSVRSNYVLILEILDEIMDYGYIQICSTEKIKPYIQSTPTVLKTVEQIPGLFGVEKRDTPGTSSNKSVIKSRVEQCERKDEIFIDFIERMTVVVDSKGVPQRCEVQGTVNMKTFLMGSPEVKVTFNENLVLGQESEKGYGSQVYLDEYKFHDCVNSERLSSDKMITVQPPEGEFVLMSYKVQGDMVHGLPFRLTFYINAHDNSRDIELGIKLKSEILSSSQAVNVKINIPLPKSVTSISQQLSGPGQTAELNKKEQSLLWIIKRLPGKEEVTAHFKLIDGNKNPETSKLEIGPIKMDFEISGFLCSNLHIKHLKVSDRDKAYTPARWVRYITTPDSYVIKLH